MNASPDWLDYLLAQCTPREKQVAELLMEGKTVTQIGRELGVSYVRIIQIREQLARRIIVAQAKSRAGNLCLWDF